MDVMRGEVDWVKQHFCILVISLQIGGDCAEASTSFAKDTSLLSAGARAPSLPTWSPGPGVCSAPERTVVLTCSKSPLSQQYSMTAKPSFLVLDFAFYIGDAMLALVCAKGYDIQSCDVERRKAINGRHGGAPA